MENLEFKSIITQSTDNTKQYERSWRTTTLTSWQDAHIIVCVLHTRAHMHTHTHSLLLSLCTIKYPAEIL